MGYRYSHSNGVNLPVGNPEYLEPQRILGNHCPRVFRVSYGLNQSYSLEHDWERLSLSSTCEVKGITSESK